MQIGLLEPDNFSAAARQALLRLGPVEAWSGAGLAAFLANTEALFVRLGYKIDRAFLDQAPKLRWLCSPTTGHTHIDEAALRERGIGLLSLRGERAFLESIRATPEHTFGLILGLLRNYRAAFAETLAGDWDRDRYRGEELAGNRVGIIGLGRVGYRVATYCAAFGAEVVWCDTQNVKSEPAWQRVGNIAELIAQSRIVVMCASYAPGQAPLIGPSEAQALAKRYFINTARGELVDEDALLSAIRADRLRGVATDVVANENGAHKLAEWRSAAAGRNLILTPHIGGATVDAMARTEEFIVQKLLKAVEGQGVACN